MREHADERDGSNTPIVTHRCGSATAEWQEMTTTVWCRIRPPDPCEEVPRPWAGGPSGAPRTTVVVARSPEPEHVPRWRATMPGCTDSPHPRRAPGWRTGTRLMTPTAATSIGRRASEPGRGAGADFFLRTAVEWRAITDTVRAMDPAATGSFHLTVCGLYREAAWFHLLVRAGRAGAPAGRLRAIAWGRSGTGFRVRRAGPAAAVEFLRRFRVAAAERDSAGSRGAASSLLPRSVAAPDSAHAGEVFRAPFAPIGIPPPDFVSLQIRFAAHPVSTCQM